MQDGGAYSPQVSGDSQKKTYIEPEKFSISKRGLVEFSFTVLADSYRSSLFFQRNSKIIVSTMWAIFRDVFGSTVRTNERQVPVEIQPHCFTVAVRTDDRNSEIVGVTWGTEA